MRLQQTLQSNTETLGKQRKPSVNGRSPFAQDLAVSMPIPTLPARKIPKNALSLTGILNCVKPQDPQRFESTFERDAMILLDSDPTVKSFLGQPVTIRYTDAVGKAHTYTPDILVVFHPDPITGITPKPLLIEVKPRKVLFDQWKELKPKFMAARKYAAGKERQWRFVILTEQEIRPKTILPNLKFLRPHLRRQPDPAWAVALLDEMRRKKECTVDALMRRLCPDVSQHSGIISNLWNLIATRQIWVDLTLPLGKMSVLRHASDPDPRFLWGAGGPPMRTRRVATPGFLPQATGVPSRKVDLRVNAPVEVRGLHAVIQRIVDLKEVVVRFEATGIRERVLISHLDPYNPAAPQPRVVPNALTLDTTELKEALRRAQWIRPLVGCTRSKDMIQRAMAGLDVKRNTVYRWLNQYVEGGELVSALAPQKPNGGRGKPRLIRGKNGDKAMNAKFEELLENVLQTYYLRSQKPTPTDTAKEFHRRCRMEGLPKPWPCANTVRKRISWIDDELRVRRREGNKVANQAYRTVKGHFPGADYPLAWVQVDHTKLDVILVDPETRKPVGRAWITVMIDLYSRMVVGYFVSFEAPGNGPLGSCLLNAVLGKEAFLKQYGVECEWPCWGFAETLHADNAKEFRGAMLQKIAQEYGFNLEWRPTKKKEYGGHIERFMGTLGKELHTLPGTTFSSIKQRGDYPSRKRAKMTLDELKHWLAHHILGEYHNRPHEGLNGETPLERWTKGILGTDDAPGRGLPPKIADSPRLRLDFLPAWERTVQPAYGLQIEGISYFDDCLKCFYDARDPKNPKLKRKFLVKWNPIDISMVYLLDPKSNLPLPIPFRNTEHPKGISYSEWKATESAKKKGASDEENEKRRFNALMEKRRVESEAKHKSDQARRNVERMNRNEAADVHGRGSTKGNAQVSKPAKKPVALTNPALSSGTVTPYTEIE